MRPFRRAIIIVCDGLGVGEAPDAAAFGDAGQRHSRPRAGLAGRAASRNLKALGLGNLTPTYAGARNPRPDGAFGKMAEKSAGKDTATGHWEMAGLVTDDAVPDLSRRVPRRDREALRGAHRTQGPGQQGRLRHRDPEGAGRGAPAHRPADPLHLRRQRVPGRGPRGRHPARAALRDLPDRIRDRLPPATESAGSSRGPSWARAATTSSARRTAATSRCRPTARRSSTGLAARRPPGLRRRKDRGHLHGPRHHGRGAYDLRLGWHRPDAAGHAARGARTSSSRTSWTSTRSMAIATTFRATPANLESPGCAAAGVLAALRGGRRLRPDRRSRLRSLRRLHRPHARERAPAGTRRPGRSRAATWASARRSRTWATTLSRELRARAAGRRDLVPGDL